MKGELIIDITFDDVIEYAFREEIAFDYEYYNLIDPNIHQTRITSNYPFFF